jgi:pyridoxine 5-phosphate synthase
MTGNRSQPRLSVNLNKVALLRNARPLNIPSVVGIGEQCIAAGAHGLTVHPRPDERHIRRHDVFDVAALLAGYPQIEYNIEGNPFTDLMELVRAVKPAQCTLVPDDLHQATSDHGWDIVKDGARLAPVIRELQDLGIRVSLFMDPDTAQIERVAELRADRIELYTEPYAAAFAGDHREAVLQQYRKSARLAQQLGIGVNAGHDLNLDNLPALLTIPGILECSIGHALTADALTWGFSATVMKYLTAMTGEQRNAA